jgi:hypothetical protein
LVNYNNSIKGVHEIQKILESQITTVPPLPSSFHYYHYPIPIYEKDDTFGAAVIWYSVTYHSENSHGIWRGNLQKLLR